MCQYIGQLVDALRACHEMGLVHRDVRLGNIVFAAEAAATPGQQQQQQLLYIIDWGFAVAAHSPGPYAGTVSYASDRVLSARAGGAPSIASAPADDLVSLVRSVFAMVHPSLQLELSLLGSDNPAVVLQFWQGQMALRTRWLQAQQAAEACSYDAVKEELQGLLQ
jgi:serine/threonine protein kinase